MFSISNNVDEYKKRKETFRETRGSVIISNEATQISTFFIVSLLSDVVRIWNRGALM